MSRQHHHGKGKKARHETALLPTPWSEWDWNAENGCWARYRLDMYGWFRQRRDSNCNLADLKKGEYEYDYNQAAASSAVDYSTSTATVPYISVEDSNTVPDEYSYRRGDGEGGREGGRDRGRKKVIPTRSETWDPAKNFGLGEGDCCAGIEGPRDNLGFI